MVNSRRKGANFNEIWKPVFNYEGLYEVSNYGRVKSLPRNNKKHESILKPYINRRNGYVYYGLYRNNIYKSHRAHKLVMEAFTEYKSLGYVLYQEIDHIDGDKTNNALSNLEVVTHLENMQRASQNGLRHYRGHKCIDLDTHEIYASHQEAARAIGGKRGGLVARVCSGVRSHYRNHRFANYDDYLNGTIPEYKGKVKKKASETLWR